MWIAQLEAHITGDSGSNPRLGENFSLKLTICFLYVMTVAQQQQELAKKYATQCQIKLN